MNIKTQLCGLPKIRRLPLILFGLCCGLVFSLNAKSPPADLAIDIDLMNFMEETNDSLTSNIALKNRDGALDDARLLNELFILLEEHFIELGDHPEGLQLAKKSTALTIKLNDEITSGNYKLATQLGINLSNTCKSCHEKFK
ncbi:hypothetical protein C2869_22055 (plasmid) [Saccharobesus litoralis]|uniref:Cytochrome C n=1 Tax=Saccharobesus litoralis TaxID=2172099 RepID=A0A2S0VYB8_9ALTE|nr:hypothetical protein [Saccharobesus litoralis]AWB69188.1 hypothetical protein C2869_22055 [Saccharobesus litoralis]